jgi:hypothetical protein
LLSVWGGSVAQRDFHLAQLALEKLAMALRGSDAMSRTADKRCILPSRAFAHSRICSAVSARPDSSTTNATGVSPHSREGDSF